MLGKPPHNGDRGANAVRRFSEAVTLIREEDVLDWHTAPLETLHHLLCFDYWYIGIVRPVKDNSRRSHSIDFMNGGESAQEFEVSVWIAILDLRDRRHPW